MKYICLGYIEPGKFEGMTEDERRLAFERHTERGEKSDSARKVVDDDADVVQSLDRHVAKYSRKSCASIESGRSRELDVELEPASRLTMGAGTCPGVRLTPGGNKMTLRDFYLKRAKAEFPVFLKVLRALPSDLSYKPDERSPSAEQLVWTITYEMKALIDVVETGKCEWQNMTPPGLDEMIGMYEQSSTELLDKVANLDEASQERNAQFLYQGHVVMEKPLVEFLWDFMFDAIHHRGQLSAYLRPMGGKVPSIYGPSADEPGM